MYIIKYFEKKVKEKITLKLLTHPIDPNFHQNPAQVPTLLSLSLTKKVYPFTNSPFSPLGRRELHFRTLPLN